MSLHAIVWVTLLLTNNILPLDRYTPLKRHLVCNLWRKYNFTTYKLAFVTFTVAHVVMAKAQRVLPRSFSTRNFQRAHRLSTIASTKDIEQLVTFTLSMRNLAPAIRPFAIEIARIRIS